MPTAGMSICTYPGCNTLVLRGRCERHPYATSNKKRPSPTQRGYGKAWQARRAEYLRDNRTCQYRTKCNGAPATEVDHIITKHTGGTDADENLVACCKRCHSYKTATQDVSRIGGRFNGRRT